jgi:hypothetical protein
VSSISLHGMLRRKGVSRKAYLRTYEDRGKDQVIRMSQEDSRVEAQSRHIRQLSRLVTEKSPENLATKKFPKRRGRCGVLAERFYVLDRIARSPQPRAYTRQHIIQRSCISRTSLHDDQRRAKMGDPDLGIAVSDGGIEASSK